MSKKRKRKTGETVCRREIPNRYRNLLRIVRMLLLCSASIHTAGQENRCITPNDSGCVCGRIVCVSQWSTAAFLEDKDADSVRARESRFDADYLKMAIHWTD